MKTLLIFAAVLVMCVGLGSAQRVECTRFGGCISYDAYGNGFHCGPGGCGRTGSGNSYGGDSSRIGQSGGGDAYSCGPDGCKKFSGDGGYGCGPQGCGPL